MTSRWLTVDPASASKIPSQACVYVIYKDGVPQYVGQTASLYMRLHTHRNASSRLFFRDPGIIVKYSFNRRYGEHAMREIRLIAAIRPPLNRAHQLSPSQIDNKPWLPYREPDWEKDWLAA